MGGKCLAVFVAVAVHAGRGMEVKLIDEAVRAGGVEEALCGIHRKGAYVAGEGDRGEQGARSHFEHLRWKERDKGRGGRGAGERQGGLAAKRQKALASFCMLLNVCCVAA